MLLDELGRGAHLYKGVSGGVESVPSCVAGGAVRDLVLSEGLVVMLSNSRGCCVIVGLEVGAYDEAVVTQGAVLFSGRELPLPVPSEDEVR